MSLESTSSPSRCQINARPSWQAEKARISSAQSELCLFLALSPALYPVNLLLSFLHLMGGMHHALPCLYMHLLLDDKIPNGV